MNMRTRHIAGGGRRLAGIVLVALGTWTAVAQNNSLFGGRRGTGDGRPVATSQPATVTWAGGQSARGTLNADRIASKSNATLLRVSPIAIEVPDPDKIRVHDLVTIIIRESKTATTDSKMESKKDWTLESELAKWIRLSDKHGIVPAKLTQGNPAAAFDWKDDYSGDGKYDRRDELTTRITACVIDVKPNGNLVLEATKQITIDDEGYAITLTGECRTKDIGADNTILSTQIAGPQINVQHTGAVRDATRRGWFKRGLDWLRPF